jgi:hypothetical protein
MARAQVRAPTLLASWLGLGSPWFIRWLGPVFRIGRNPILRLCFGCKISDIGDGTLSGSYGTGPTTVLDHFRMESRYLAHHSTMRSEPPVCQLGSPPRINMTYLTQIGFMTPGERDADIQPGRGLTDRAHAVCDLLVVAVCVSESRR